MGISLVTFCTCVDLNVDISSGRSLTVTLRTVGMLVAAGVVLVYGVVRFVVADFFVVVVPRRGVVLGRDVVGGESCFPDRLDEFGVDGFLVVT